jgi:hypothetical protein
MENLIKLAVVLNVQFEWLATGRGDMPYLENREFVPVHGFGDSSLPRDQRDLLDIFLSLSSKKQRVLIDFMEILHSLERQRKRKKFLENWDNDDCVE